jgi:isopentenyldiphosphate isomerase
MTEEILDIIDENDTVIRTATRQEVRDNHLLHRGSCAFVFNSKGEIFVHKRTSTKHLYPGRYDMACGGGVDSGETYEEGAKRELNEELGIKNAELKFLFKFRWNDRDQNCISGVYKCIYDEKMNLQEEEIESGSFVTLEQLNKLIKKEKFCPDSLKMYLKYQEEFQ